MHQPIIIQTYFDDFQAAKIKKGVYNHDCYNFNKTRFKVGVGQDQWVITKNKSSRLYMKDLENCEYLSSLVCISEERDVSSNILILNRKQHLEKWFKKNNLNDNVAFVVSDSGYSNNKINLK